MANLPDSEIKKARETDILGLVERYGLKVEKRGSNYFALCPFHNEKSPSFTVTPNVDGTGNGRYHCMGCGANGDPIQFVKDYETISFRDAVHRINGTIAAEIAPRERRTIEREEPELWVPLALVPENVPSPMDVVNRKVAGRWAKLSAANRWEYRDPAGVLIGYIYRFDLPGGGKEVVPQTYCVNQTTGEMSWRWLSFSKPRPIYGLELLFAHPDAQVLVVEGEKACDAARKHFADAGIPASKLIVVSWPGGGKAVKHVDWAPLFRRKLALLPDADQKPYVDTHPKAGQIIPFLEQIGTATMRDIFERVREQCEGVKFIAPPAGVPDGWDLADDLPPGFAIKAFMKTSQLAVDVFAAPAPLVEAEPDMGEAPPWDDVPVMGGELVDDMPPMDDEPAAAAPPAPPKKPLTDAEEHDKFEDPALTHNGYFRILGYDHERYYVLQHEKAQIMVYTKSDFSEPGLIELAPMEWWETYFPVSGKEGQINKKAAMNWIVRKAHSRGVYSMTRLRGRGGWMDKGRIVFHHGGYLTVDGQRVTIKEMDSYYVYEKAEALPDVPEEAMTDEQGRDLLELASIFRWAKPASAALMAGWCALAPIGGVIKWRPHIWMTGGAGSGKSTALNRFVHHLMNGVDIYANGNSTEAGIRQRLRGDARPVLFDESESNTEKETMRIQQVLAMVRQASTESPAETLKGTAGGDAMSFLIRSMFCLASIQVGIKYQADVERMTVLALQPKHTDDDPADSWKRIDNALHVMQKDETLPGRLMRRSIELLPTTLQNITIFSEAAAIRFGSQRDGDQYGTLLAGAWSLISREVTTMDAALEMIDMYNWDEHRENNEADESERALATLMGALIRVPGGVEVSVNELMRAAKGYAVDGTSMPTLGAEAMLARYGMRIEGERLVLSNGHPELRRLMAGTPFEADLRGVLLRLKGSDRCDNKNRKFNGVSSKAISIPLDGLLDDFVDEPVPATGQVMF